VSGRAAGVLGAVAAGGESRRFGRSKAWEPVGGVPMLLRAVSALTPVVGRVVVVSSRPIPKAPVDVIPDRTAGRGPLGALDAALAEARVGGEGAVFLLGCDMPMVTPELVAFLVALRGEAEVVVPGRPGAFPPYEPLCGLYAVSLLPAVEELMRHGSRGLHHLIDMTEARVVPPDSLAGVADTARALVNVNTVADRDRVEAWLSVAPGEAEGGASSPEIGSEVESEVE